jgi:two-component system cell cycle sensor histidine kinase/response regulator CckA
MAVMAALGLWLADTVLDSYVFHDAPFWGALLTQVKPDDLFERFVSVLAVAIVGIYLSRYWQRQQHLRAALVESEELTQNLFAEAPLPYQSLDVTGRILNVSQLWLDTLGYTADEVIGRYFCEFLTPFYAGMFPEQFAKFLANGNVAALEIDLVRKDGTIITASFNGRVVFDGQGKFVRTHCLFVDITERRNFEKELQSSEEKYRLLVEHANEAVFVAQHGIVKFCNQRLSKMLGYSVERITSEPFAEYIYADDRSAALERHQRRLAGERLSGTEDLRVIAADGSVKWLEANGVLIEWEGEPAILNFANDITERKEAELALGEERRRLKDIIKGTNVGTWEFTVATGETVISNRWAEMLGYTLEELSPLTMEKWNELTHPDDLRASNEKLRQHFEGELNYYECELRMRHKSGNWVWILDRGRVHTWSDDGKPLLMSGTHQDITERKIAEETLRMRESYLSAIIENQPGLMWLKDLDSRFLTVNHEFARSCGREKPENVVGLTDIDVWPRELADRYRSDDAEVMKSGKSIMVEEPISDRGETKWFETFKTPVFDRHGTILGTTGYAHDIAERKKAEEALRESKERYKRLLASVTDYIYTVRIEEGKPVSTSYGEGCLAVTGYTPKDFEENPCLWLEMTFKEDRQAVQEHVAVMLSGATIPPLEHRIVHKNGSIRWVKNTPSLHSNESGSIVSYEGLISDITERRAAADELARSEIKYRTLFESAQDAIFLMKDYLFVDCNSTTCEMFGCIREQILGKPPDQFSPAMQPDGNRSKDKALEKMNEAMAGRSKFFEWTHAKLDGTCFDAEVSLNGIKIDGEQHILAIVRDITERKQSQKALERSLSLQQATIESTADGILVVDRAGKVSSFNRKFLEMWHIPEFLAVLKDDEKLLKYVTDQLKDPQRFVDRVKQLYANPKSQSYDIVEFKDGRVFERYSQSQQVGDEVVGRVWSFRDLTERKRVEMELARLATATEQAAEAIVMIDLEGQIEYVNPAFEKITGYRRDETIGKNMRTISSSEHNDDFYNELWRVLRGGQVWTGSLRSCRKDGSLYEEECSISPIRDQSGAIVSYVAVKRDITQEAELENRLRQSQKLEAVGLLAAGIAHDFNNLLAGIKGFAELLTLDEEAGPKVSDYAGEILKAANRAADLTGQLLAFARKGRFLSVAVNVNEVIDEVKTMLKHSIDRRIEIKTDCRAEKPFTSGDPSQIQSAILNLAINARDAMPDGGELKFETENVHLDDDFCQLHSLDLGAGDYLAISVTDTGIGMDEEVMAYIFDPFFTTKEQGQGTGLGLAGVYGCLKNHHGSIEVISQPGSGSTFKLLFPVTIAENQSVPPNLRRLKLTGEERLLLVEDEELVRNLAFKILTNAGYHVTACADGMEAVALYREKAADFDLVLLDMMMRKMHGKDAFVEMKLVNPDVCALLMSGYTDYDVQELLDLGIKGFIAKPFHSKQLLQKIREALESTTSQIVRESQRQ